MRVDVDICSLGLKDAASISHPCEFWCSSLMWFYLPVQLPYIDHVCYRPAYRTRFNLWFGYFMSSHWVTGLWFQLVMDNINTDYWATSFSLSVSLKARSPSWPPNGPVQFTCTEHKAANLACVHIFSCLSPQSWHLLELMVNWRDIVVHPSLSSSLWPHSFSSGLLLGCFLMHELHYAAA